ncbi:UbiA prenyltransferase family protein [Gigaspora margarita]|uniref:UbiA prenyltransferase family protein n=1 Tax=Gigaspora margarita TaxID=4874 RepID=A0A8H4EVA9_GIGMA|nr:UbiA prenyltransferase family protein [Gigaspora margarita]
MKLYQAIKYYTNTILAPSHKILSRLWPLLIAIRYEILIIYKVTVADWTTAIIPPLLMAIGAFYMYFFSSISTYDGGYFNAILHVISPRIFRVIIYFTNYLIFFNWFNQLNSVEEDRINKPFRPIPSGLITVKGAKYHLAAFSIIYPIIAYLIGGLSSLCLCFMWQAWTVFNEVLKLGKNAFHKNLFSAVGMWIQLASCYYIMVDTDPGISELLNNKPCLFKFAIFFFILTTAQVQDMGDQKGDKLSGRKTLPLLMKDNTCRWLTVLMLAISFLMLHSVANVFLLTIAEENLENNIIDGFVGKEFGIVEFILLALNVFTCIRLFMYRDPKHDSFTYQIGYGGIYCTMCLYYGMCINKYIKY